VIRLVKWIFKSVWHLLWSLISIAVVLIIVYVVYVVASYQRVPDSVLLEVENIPEKVNCQDSSLTELASCKEVDYTSYTLLSWNLGFGAYDPNFSFFMDESTLTQDVEGVGKSGDHIVGKSSTASSQESVEMLTLGALDFTATILGKEPDFIMYQEIDRDSHRSFKVNQVEMAQEIFGNHQTVFASNFHTPWLQYPVLNPIGNIDSGLLLLSKYNIDSATRKSLPVSEDIPTKFFDLDRCYEVVHYPIQDSELELILINVHLSAYDDEGEFKKQQLEKIMSFAQKEYQKGNYIVIGGDFNSAFGDSYNLWTNAEAIPSWIVPFDETMIPEGFQIVNPYENGDNYRASVRDSSFSYIPGQNYQTTTDGFIVSNNIFNPVSSVLDTNFQYSDHNPVLLTFNVNKIY